MTFKVKREMCPTCIFRPGNLMSLRAGRVRDMVEEARAADSFIVCHDTIDYDTREEGDVPGRDEAMCRGYLDAGNYPQMLRIADRLNMVQEV